MTIFLTGATGFIGKHVLKLLLLAQHRVIALTRFDINPLTSDGQVLFIRGSLADTQAWKRELEKEKIDVCIHLAWEGIPDYTWETSILNFNCGINLLMLCRELSVRHLVVTGSCWEYDAPQGCIREDYPTGGKSPFQAAKNSLRLMSEAFCLEYGMVCHWLRLFYVYGPGQKKSSLIPMLMNEYANGRRPALRGAYNENDFIHVTDAAEAIKQAAECALDSAVWNVGTGRKARVMDLAAAIALKYGVTEDTSRYAAASSISSFYADTGAIRKALGWRPALSIGQGIETLFTG